MANMDVAIIGAGPAGSVAAHQLAQQGIGVALFDSAAFPRDKSCGDGVGARGLAVLDRMGLGEWASQFLTPEVFRVTAPDGKVLEAKPDDQEYCFGRVIPRLLFDNTLVQAATSAGAALYENTRIDHVELHERGATLHSNGARYSSRLLILADGSHAPISRKLGLVKDNPDLYAVRQYFTGDTDQKKVIEFHFQPWIIPGYTWIFPMAEGRANVGTGTVTSRLKEKNVDLRRYMQRFVEEQKMNGGRLSGASPDGVIRGHPLRTHFNRSRVHAKNVMVVGDAAGLVNPLSGEGISSGMESGEIAAKHAVSILSSGNFSEGRFAAYSREIRRQFQPDWRAARFFRQALIFPQFVNFMFKRMGQDRSRVLLFSYLLLNHVPQRKFLRPDLLLKLVR